MTMHKHHYTIPSADNQAESCCVRCGQLPPDLTPEQVKQAQDNVARAIIDKILIERAGDVARTMYRLMNYRHVVFFASRADAVAYRREHGAFYRCHIKSVLQLQPSRITYGIEYERG